MPLTTNHPPNPQRKQLKTCSQIFPSKIINSTGSSQQLMALVLFLPIIMK